MEGEVGRAAELFGGCVGGGADNGVEQGELALSADRAHEAEVHYLDVQIAAGADDHDIGGFEVAVDELIGVDVFERGADLVEEGDEAGQGETLIGLSAADRAWEWSGLVRLARRPLEVGDKILSRM